MRLHIEVGEFVPCIEIRYFATAGDRDMEAALYDDENALVQWAVKTRHALELCAANPH
jgi:hypothetical protein